jgi:hypothetical protein
LIRRAFLGKARSSSFVSHESREHPTSNKARRIGPTTAGTGACRSASKSSIELALIDAAEATFPEVRVPSS